MSTVTEMGCGPGRTCHAACDCREAEWEAVGRENRELRDALAAERAARETWETQAVRLGAELVAAESALEAAEECLRWYRIARLFDGVSPSGWDGTAYRQAMGRLIEMGEPAEMTEAAARAFLAGGKP